MGASSASLVNGRSSGAQQETATHAPPSSQQQQQHINLTADLLQQNQQFSPQRRRSSNGQTMSFSNQIAGSCAQAAESFEDDDEVVHTVRDAAAASQPEPDPASNADAALTVDTRVEYRALPRGETKDVFGLITVQAASAPPPIEPSASAASEERQPMDLMCVLDVSGSMNGEKLQQVQSAVRFVIEQSTAQDRLSIVSFQSHARRELRMRRMDVAGKDEANVSTLRLKAGGGTRIASGLGMALSVMEQRRYRSKVSAILLLTDGQDGSCRHELPGLLARAQAANCAVYTFGFGRDHDAKLLSEMAEQAHTPFTFVEDASNIREAFAGAVGGLTSMIAQNVELRINCTVSLKNAHTGFVMNRVSDQSASVIIPDMFAGETRNVPVELEVPANSEAEDVTLLETYVRYTDLRSGTIVQTAPVKMSISRVEEPQPEMEPDMEVVAQRERVEVTQALKLATRQSDEGNFDEAQRVLDEADVRMKARNCQSKLSPALAEEIADAKGRMRSRSQWEGGGRAEVLDSCQMHQMERCTNTFASSSASRAKCSKAMYLSPNQASWVSRSKRSA